jgi:hypothetical protein
MVLQIDCRWVIPIIKATLVTVDFGLAGKSKAKV